MPGIVVEGCDGAGKTTLIKALRNRLFWPTVHVVQPGRPDVQQMLKLLTCSPLIIDRFHLSPIVYGEALRDGPELTPYDVWALEGLLIAQGYTGILCSTDATTMMVNNLKVEQLWEATRELETVEKLDRLYHVAADSSLISFKHYDYQAPVTLDDVGGPAASIGYLGTNKPFVLLVGDEVNHRGPKLEEAPFYTQGNNGKLVGGTLLCEAMLLANLDWRVAGLVNSVYLHQVRDLAQLYEQLGRPRVIALGNNADLRLDTAGVPHTKIPHPQWARRFKHHEAIGLYTSRLKECLR